MATRNWIEVIPPELREEFRRTFYADTHGKLPEVSIKFAPHAERKHLPFSNVYMRLSYLGQHTSMFSTGIEAKKGKHVQVGNKRLHSLCEKIQAMPIEFHTQHGYWPSLEVIKNFALQQIRVIKDDRSLVAMVERYANEQCHTEGTKKNYRSLARQLERYGDETLDSVNAEWVESFACSFEGKASTARNKASMTLAALKYAGKEIIMPENSIVFKKGKARSASKDNKKLFLTKEELELLKGIEWPDEKTRRTVDLYLFCCATGDRWDELKSYKPGDDKLDKALIRINKTDRGFEKEWMGDARERLAAYNGEEFSYKDSKGYHKGLGLPLSYRVQRDIPSILSKYITSEIMYQGERVVKGEVMTFHSSKHTHIVHRLQDGETPEQIARSLNMSPKTVEDYYSDYQRVV